MQQQAGPSAAGQPLDITNEKLYDTADLLQLLHISARTLQYWRKEGIIQFIKVRKKIYYRQRDVEAMLRRNECG
jgi:predicted site-specific integrase-resolvase